MAGKASSLGSDQTNVPTRSSSVPSVGDAAGSANEKLSHIRKEIRETEARMATTISAIEEKLAPSRLVNQAKEHIISNVLRRSETMMATAGDMMRKSKGTILQKIENNPVPVTLLGLGLGWLMVDTWKGQSGSKRYRYSYDSGDYPIRESSQDTSYQYSYGSGDYPATKDSGESHYGGEGKAKHALEQARKTGAEYAEQAKQKVRQYGEDAQHQVGQLKERTRHLTTQATHQYHRGRDSVSKLMQESPLLLGAATVALGLVVGLLVPETQRERELMGETRDDLLQKAYEAGRQAKEKAQNIVMETGRAVAEEAEKQDLTASATMEKLGRVAEEARNTAAEKLDEEIGSR